MYPEVFSAQWSVLNWSNLLATAIATFVGASVAFGLNLLREYRAIRANRIDAGRRALFSLVHQRNNLTKIRNQSLDANQMRDNPNRHLHLIPLEPFVEPTPMIDYVSLSYMLGDRTEPELLYNLSIAEYRYLTAIGTLNRRNAYHTARQHDGTLSDPRMIPVYEIQLQNLTDALYENFDDALKIQDEIYMRLRAYLINRVPEARFHNVEYGSNSHHSEPLA